MVKLDPPIAVSSVYAEAARFINAIVEGTLTISGAVATAGNFIVGGILTVTGNTNLNSNLAVTGASTLTSLHATANAVFDGLLAVTGVVTAASDLNVGGDTAITGNLTTAGNTSTSGNASIGGTLDLTGMLTASADAAVGGNLDVANNTTLTGNLSVSGTTTVQTPTLDAHATTKAYVDAGRSDLQVASVFTSAFPTAEEAAYSPTATSGYIFKETSGSGAVLFTITWADPPPCLVLIMDQGGGTAPYSDATVKVYPKAGETFSAYFVTTTTGRTPAGDEILGDGGGTPSWTPVYATTFFLTMPGANLNNPGIGWWVLANFPASYYSSLTVSWIRP